MSSVAPEPPAQLPWEPLPLLMAEVVFTGPSLWRPQQMECVDTAVEVPASVSPFRFQNWEQQRSVVHS